MLLNENSHKNKSKDEILNEIINSDEMNKKKIADYESKSKALDIGLYQKNTEATYYLYKTYKRILGSSINNKNISLFNVNLITESKNYIEYGKYVDKLNDLIV